MEASGHFFKVHFPRQLTLSSSWSRQKAATGCCTLDTEAHTTPDLSLPSAHWQLCTQHQTALSHTIPCASSGGRRGCTAWLIPNPASSQSISSSSLLCPALLGCRGKPPGSGLVVMSRMIHPNLTHQARPARESCRPQELTSYSRRTLWTSNIWSLQSCFRILVCCSVR